MAITETALLGIACLTANATAGDQQAMMKDLNLDEQATVQEMIETKLCVPERLKQLLEAGRQQAARGEANDSRTESNPTLRC